MRCLPLLPLMVLLIVASGPAAAQSEAEVREKTEDLEVRWEALSAREDLQRWRNDRPVMARRPTVFGQAVKFVRRNRTLVVAASLVFLSLVTALVVSLQGLRDSRKASESSRRALERSRGRLQIVWTVGIPRAAARARAARELRGFGAKKKCQRSARAPEARLRSTASCARRPGW